MAKKHHKIKCEKKYYQAIERGKKKFELRLNDRNYQVGDTVTLLEVDGGVWTTRSLPPVEIQYVLQGGVYGLPEDMCIFNW